MPLPHAAQARIFDQPKQDVLGARVVVFHSGGFALGARQRFRTLAAQVRAHVAAVAARTVVEHLLKIGQHLRHARADLGDRLRHDAVFLLDERDHDVQRIDRWMPAFGGQ